MFHGRKIIDKVFYFESVEKTAKQKVSAHYHDLFEIYFLTSGCCNFFIENRTYRVNVGDVVIIPDGVIHKTNYSSSTHSRMIINCYSQLLPSSVLSAVTEGRYLFKIPTGSTEIRDCFRRIKDEYSKGDRFSEDSLRALLHILLISVVRLSEQSGDFGDDVSSSEKAIEYIQKNFRNKISLGDVAKYCSVSSEHLCRTFKKQTGVGFNEYLCLLRLSEADSLLINQPGVSIADIAFQCGFNDSNYFSNVYKKIYGITPSEKKKQKNS